MTLIEEYIHSALNELIGDIDFDYAVQIPAPAYDKYTEKYTKIIKERIDRGIVDGKTYRIEDGYLFTWCDGWPRHIHTESSEDVFVPDYGCGWYNRGKDTPENRKKYGIPEE